MIRKQVQGLWRPTGGEMPVGILWAVESARAVETLMGGKQSIGCLMGCRKPWEAQTVLRL